MTENKALKNAVRKRMAETGEPYNTARRNVLVEHEATANLSTRKSGASTHRAVKSPYVGAGAKVDMASVLGTKVDMAKVLGLKVDMASVLGTKVDMAKVLGLKVDMASVLGTRVDMAKVLGITSPVVKTPRSR